MRNRDVSVVVLTKNSGRTIERCIRSVIEQQPSEIIAVDRMSVDGTLNILDRYGIKVVVDRVGSLGLSRQLGVQSCSSPFLMFVDSDVRLGDGCITRLRDELQKYGFAGIHASVLSWENASYWQRAEDEVTRIFVNRPGPRKQISTTAALFRREILLKYPFDPSMSRSCEDVDLCRRLARNMEQVSVSSAVAYHYHRREFLAWARQKFGYGLGDARLGLKYGSIRILINPLMSAFSQVARSVLRGKIRLVPYWATAGVVQFLGVLCGLSREYGSSHNLSRIPRQPESHLLSEKAYQHDETDTQFT
jgi:glycosyltransferase involved in cell wall biosynthesis